MENNKDHQMLNGEASNYLNNPEKGLKIFQKRAKEMIDFVADYLENIEERKIVPQVKPGYINTLIPSEAPIKPDHWEDLMADIDNVIIPGITNWHHPNFHSYFPTGNSYASIYGDILSDAISSMGFSWSANPAGTEMEIAMVDWLARMLHLPEAFLSQSQEGRGLIYISSSEAILVALFAARSKALKAHPDEDKYSIVGKLVGYYSDQANLCVERAGVLSMIKMKKVKSVKRQMPTSVLKEMIEEDIKNGLIPFYVSNYFDIFGPGVTRNSSSEYNSENKCVVTLGTPGSCAFDKLDEIGPVCEKYNIWLHVDAAYAGSAFICPEFRYLMKGIEYAMSFAFNAHDWLLVNFDCSIVWFRHGRSVMEYFQTDAPYMKTEILIGNNDLRHWQIPLGRRFRSLKLWFVLRLHGVEGLQKYIRNHVRLAHLFEDLLRMDKRFEIVEEVTLGVVCFRLKGGNELNEELYKRIEQEGKIHLLMSKFVDTSTTYLRFAICYQFASDEHIKFAYQSIIDLVNEGFDS